MERILSDTFLIKFAYKHLFRKSRVLLGIRKVRNPFKKDYGVVYISTEGLTALNILSVTFPEGIDGERILLKRNLIKS